MLSWVKKFSFFIYRVLSYLHFCRKNTSTRFRINITKKFVLDLHFSTCTYRSVPQKKPFFEFLRFLVPEILPFQTLFSKKYLYLTFAVVNLRHHATYCWKAPEEYISNIYTFMGQKPFIFHIQHPIRFPFLPKKYLNSLSHQYYQKLFFGFTFFYIHQLIPF